MPNWHVALVALLLLVQPPGPLGRQSVRIAERSHGATGLDQISTALIAAFNDVDVVALGESHWRKFDSDLRIRMISDPTFAAEVRNIVVEFANVGDQALLDRYVNGEDIAPLELAQVWRNTASAPGPDHTWDSPVYRSFFAAVREVNRSLPDNKRLRVWAGGSRVGSNTEFDEPAVAALRKLLDQGEKALVIFGNGHLDYREGNIARSIQSSHPGHMFVVLVHGGPDPLWEKFESALSETRRPILISWQREPFRGFSAEQFLGHGGKIEVDGVWVDIVQFQGLVLQQMADACIYLGMSEEMSRDVPLQR